MDTTQSANAKRALNKRLLSPLIEVDEKKTLPLCGRIQYVRYDVDFLNNVIIGFFRGRISSLGRALDCRAEGRGFDSRDRANTQGIKITEK